MTDPFSITAGVVGIVVPALHGTRLLLEALQQLKDAPEAIKRLKEDVNSVDTALELLKGIEESEWCSLGADVAEQSKSTISSSTQACHLFRADLKKWTRHSEDGKLAWLDRANVGFFKKGQVKAISEQLQSCKLAINLIVGVATLYSSVRSSHITEEIRNVIATKQEEVKSAITSTDKQLIVLENKVDEMNINDDDEEVASPVEGEIETLRQLEEELKGVRASQKLLSELLSRSQEEAVVRAAGNQSQSQSGSITVSVGNNSSGINAGIINGGVSGISFGEGVKGDVYHNVISGGANFGSDLHQQVNNYFVLYNPTGESDLQTWQNPTDLSAPDLHQTMSGEIRLPHCEILEHSDLTSLTRSTNDAFYGIQNPCSNQLSCHTEARNTATDVTLRPRACETRPRFSDGFLGGQRDDTLGSGACGASYSSTFFDLRNDQNLESQIWSGTKAKEKAPVIPIPETIPAPYLNVPDLCKENGPSTDCPCIFMDIEFGQFKVANEKKRYWAHLGDNDPNLKAIKARKRNGIDQYVLRWKKGHCLQTTGDYHILTHELRNRREGLTLQEKGRPKDLMVTNEISRTMRVLGRATRNTDTKITLLN